MASNSNEVNVLKLLDQSKIKTVTIILAILGALGGFLFGFDTGIIGSAIVFVAPTFHLTPFLEGLSVASVTIGAAVGAITAGLIADFLGRKYTLILDATIFAVFAIALALSINDLTFIIFRTIIGYAIGVDSVIGPVYIAEFAPVQKRGMLLAFQQFMIVTGIFISYFVGLLLAPSANWRLMVGLGALPAIIILAMRFYMPESPRFAIIKNQIDKLKNAVKRFGYEISEEGIKFAQEEIAMEKKYTFKTLFKRSVLPITIFGILIGLFSQTTGINIFIYYSPLTFQILGYSTVMAVMISTIVTGSTNVWTTALEQYLLLDRIGRRKSILIGYAGVTIMLIIGYLILKFLTGTILGWSFAIMIILFLLFFEIGVGTVQWVIMPEIFPTSIRARGSAVVAFFVWIGDFIVTFTYPALAVSIGIGNTFLIYAVISGIATFIFYRLSPETAKKSLEDISNELWSSKIS